MHRIQKKILELANTADKEEATLRRIAELIGEDLNQPNKIRHHIQMLEEKELIRYDRENKKLIRLNCPKNISDLLISVPILGSANCGPATAIANNQIEGYLKLSKSIIRKKNTKSLFAIKAIGTSMNRATIDGQSVDEGDYLIVEGAQKQPKNNDYVVSIIDGMANVKKIKISKESGQIILVSESTKELSPIFIHPKDLNDYLIAGTVIQVIKNPK